jgi:hypothetical protein
MAESGRRSGALGRDGNGWPKGFETASERTFCRFLLEE